MYHIFHNITITFSLWDRFKILLGKKVQVEVKIQTGDEDVIVKATETGISVDYFFPKKHKQEQGYGTLHD